MDGVLNLLKPPGMTSHDVVDFVRKTMSLRRVGHTGTLDPGAAGVLPICLGRATRISEYLLGSDKTYRAVLVLGVETDTYDAQGRIMFRADASGIVRDDLEQALVHFRGIIEQVPPMVSAARHQGERLYRLARKGATVERLPRRVRVSRLDLVDWKPGERARAVLDIVCSKGTYVRNICHDLGKILGCGGYLDFLVRVRHGPFRQSESITLEELADAVIAGREGSIIVSMVDALSFLPRITLAGEEVRRVGHGQSPAARSAAVLAADGPATGRLVRLCAPDDSLVAVARVYPCPGEGTLLSFSLEKVLV